MSDCMRASVPGYTAYGSCAEFSEASSWFEGSEGSLLDCLTRSGLMLKATAARSLRHDEIV